MTGKVTPLNVNFPERKPDQVTTFDLLSTSTIGWRTNPDTLVGRHGLTIYSKMANDEQVKAVLNFKRDAITARGWQFAFRDGCSLDDDEQALRRRVFGEVIARMRGSFADALNAIMTGRAYGFSITEKVYGQFELDGKTWPGINMLLGRDPITFRFYTDEYGVLEKIEQQTHRAGTVVVDRARVIHYVHAPEWDHVYGRSDLREAYRSWYIKDQVSNLWPLYLERFAGGFLHAAMAPDASLSSAELDALDEALKKARSLGAIRTPPGVTLNVVHPPQGADMYERALQFHDLAIAKALLVPNLLGISQAGGGSYAQSQTQLEAFFWTLNADAVRLEECINEQLFRDLGDQAWGDSEYPEFRFKPASVEHVKWVISTWAQMLGAGAVIPTVADEAFLRKLLEMPERDDDDQTIAQANAELAPAPPQPMGGDAGPTEADILDGLLPPDDLTLGSLLGDKQTPVGKGELREFARRQAFAVEELDLRGYRELKNRGKKRVVVKAFPDSAASAAEVERVVAELKDAGYAAKRSNDKVNEQGGFGPGYSFEHPEDKRKIDIGASRVGAGWQVEIDVHDLKVPANTEALKEFIAAQVRAALVFHLPGAHDQQDHAGGSSNNDERWAKEMKSGHLGDNSSTYVGLVKELPQPPKEVVDLIEDYAEAPFPADSEEALMLEAHIAEHGAKLQEATVLWRGFPYPGGDKAVRRAFAVGATLKPIGIQSASLDWGTAADFSTMTAQEGDASVMLRIVPSVTGVRALPVPLSGQSEFVLSQSARMTIVSKPKKRSDGIWEIGVRARDP